MTTMIKLRRAIRLNKASNPELAWQLCRRILSSSSSLEGSSSCVPVVARLLLDSGMHSEVHQLSELVAASHNCLLSLVTTLARQGPFHLAFRHFKLMRSRFPDAPPSTCLYNVLFRCCVEEGRLDSVSWLYKDMIVSRVPPDTYTFNLLIRVLCDSGNLRDARLLFDRMPDKGCAPDEYTFGILVRGYCKAGLPEEGLQLLEDMTRFGAEPNRVIYDTLISCFCKEGSTDVAESLVERMRGNGLVPDVVTFNSRISALCHSGNVLEASRIFRDMQLDEDMGLPRPNIITYNLMLGGFFQEGMLVEAQNLVESMRKGGYLSRVESFNILLSGLVRNGKLFEAQLVLKDMVSLGIQPNIYSYNILIDGLCKNNMLSDAKKLMGLMLSRGLLPDTVTYSTLLHGYCSNGKVAEANNVLQEMASHDCFPSTYTCNILLHSLWKNGKVAEAEDLLQKMTERGCSVDVVSCNIVIDGLCKIGQLDKAIGIVNQMWTHGSSALGNLGNSFMGFVDDWSSGNKCTPDSVTYLTIISGMCKAGRFDEAKKKFVEMIGKDLRPDFRIYNCFIHYFCKDGKISSAFRVLKDMERKGCRKTLQTYNSLILGLGSKNQIFEVYGLMDEMRERGIFPDVTTYNNVFTSLCEGGRTEDAPSVLDEMMQKGVSPNFSTFRILIRAFCEMGDFVAAQEVFEIAVDVCGYNEALYSLMFNEILVRGQIPEAKALFETALNRGFNLGNFNYRDLIERLCQDEKLEDASDILYKLVDKQYRIDPAAFMPVIDGFNKNGNKHDAGDLAEKMMALASEDKVDNKIHHKNRASSNNKRNEAGKSDWYGILHRDDGSGIALRALKRVQKGWGQGNISSLGRSMVLAAMKIENLFITIPNWLDDKCTLSAIKWKGQIGLCTCYKILPKSLADVLEFASLSIFSPGQYSVQLKRHPVATWST